jgi:tetratricopeptide (TPR) repeat protein
MNLFLARCFGLLNAASEFVLGKPGCWREKSDKTAFALNEEGKGLFRSGNLEAALNFFNAAIHIKQNFAAAYGNRGAVFKELKRFAEALDSFDNALRINPWDANAHYNKALTFLDLKLPLDALDSLDVALAIHPLFAEAHNSRGVVLKELKRDKEGEACFDAALAIQPDYAEAYYNRGLLLQELKQQEEALASYSAALSFAPNYCEAFAKRGILLLEIKRPREALRDFDAALAIKPDLPDVLSQRGLALLALDLPEEAFRSFCAALSSNSGSADTHNFRGIALARLSRLEEALSSFDAALVFEPEYAEAYSNRGAILMELGRIEEALASYDAALSFAPDSASALWNKSLYFLTNGNYREGWKLYEWRWMRDEIKPYQRFKENCWLGQANIAGKTLLIYPEQGLGDYIQFCRYALILKNMDIKVVLVAPPALVSVVSAMNADIDVVEDGRNLPDFDYQCPIMSLPLALGTEVAAIPHSIPYLFSDDLRKNFWQSKLGNATRPRIGLVWSGSTTHQRDQNRSLPLAFFAPVLDLPLEFHSLQVEVRSSDKDELSRVHRIELHADELHDFGYTAGLIAAMDLIISVDTSVAHLAGAMGKPVWILLPFAPDFRWMLGRADSPWYPTATLYRQPRMGDWESVISEVKQDVINRYTLN